jgi:hypothetical protein
MEEAAMLRKILDYQFNLQGRPIDRSGQNNHGVSIATVASSGPGDIRAVGFLSPNSRIYVPYNMSWSHLNSVQVEVTVLLSELIHRVNLVEVERALALFVRADGVVTFTYFAPDDDGDEPGFTGDIDAFTAIPPPSGSTDPFETLTANPLPPTPPFVWQGVNTDTDFSPDGVRRTVPLNQYVTIRALHDGFATMRIYIDGELAGVRTDIVHGVPPLVPPGIVAIGAWPHDERYTLKGNIDYLQVWREDPEFPYREFFCRDMSAEAEACWHKLFGRLGGAFDNPETKPAVHALLKCVSDMQIAMARGIAKSGEQERQELRALSDAYLKQWCGGAIEGPALAMHLKRFISFLERINPDGFRRILPNLLDCFADAKTRELCRLADGLGECDPGWGIFIKAIGNALPNPICPPPEDDADQKDPSCDHPDDDARGKSYPKGGYDAD